MMSLPTTNYRLYYQWQAHHRYHSYRGKSWNDVNYGVVDTRGKFAFSVNDVGSPFAASDIDTVGTSRVTNMFPYLKKCFKWRLWMYQGAKENDSFIKTESQKSRAQVPLKTCLVCKGTI